MPAERFFINCDLNEGTTVSLKETELHHLAHVMRVRISEEVELVNGRGALAIGRLEAVTKKEATLTVLSVQQTPLPSPSLILAVPLMRLAKLEWILEKCTELGADAFWLYPAQGSEKEELSPHQLERLTHIAISAMKQCGRLDLPPLKILKRFEEIFTTSAIYLFGDTRKDAQSLERKEGLIVCITGPEKGFSEKELKLLDQKGRGVKIHSNILRAETAPLVVTCLLRNLNA